MENKNQRRKRQVKVKSPFRLIVTIILLCALVYVGLVGAVSIITGEPVNFAFWSSGSRSQTVQDFVVAGVDDDEVRTDLILFCRYNLSDNSIRVLQIPRDTKVDTDRSDKKINSAYGTSEKTEALFDEVEGIIGIRPQRYVIVSFKAFRELIDAIGGVEVNVPIRMYYTDPYQNLTIDLYPGTQVLDGRKAEMFMRFRKNNDGTGYPNGDIDRMAAQKQFYEAVMNKLLSGGTVLKAPKILGIINENVKTDFTGDDIVRYIGRIPKFKTENVKIMSLPGEGGYDTNGVSYFFCDKAATKELIKQEFAIAKPLADDKDTSRNRSVKVRIVDATGIDPEQADALKVVSETLSDYGFKVISAERASKVSEHSKIVNHNDKKYGELIQKIYIGVDVDQTVERYVKEGNEKEPDVTLYMGTDFSF